MTKLTKETARAKFRSSTAIKDIQEIGKKDPNYEYKKVCATFKEGLGRIDRYIDKGWEVVYSNEKLSDDRSTSASQGGSDTSNHSKPVSSTSKSGDTYILMRCSKEQREINENEKHQVRKTNFEAMQKRKPVQAGKNLKITGDDVDL